jgi:hypothetical protein
MIYNRMKRIALITLLLAASASAQLLVTPARTLAETKIGVFTKFKVQPSEQTLEHHEVLANFRLHLEYRLPSTEARLTVRPHPSASVSLPAGKADEWRVLDLQYEQLVGKPASLFAKVDGSEIANVAAIKKSKRAQLTEQVTFPGGIAGVPTHLTLIASGSAEIRNAWVQALGDAPHADLLRLANEDTLKRGQQIYTTLCVSCHGTANQEGSMPTSRKLHHEPLKNGNDPFRIYQTITSGYGQMMPLPIPVDDRYAVMQYLREEVLQRDNPSQFFKIDEAYLSDLPLPMRTLAKAGKMDQTPFYQKMDFGPALHWTYQVSPGNIAYKGIAIRLDEGMGGVSKGRAWMLYDHDTMRVAASWSGEGFVDWSGIAFDGSHGTHTSITGDLAWENPVGPGWANPATGDWKDPRQLGRDDKPYGPLPREWARYRGLHFHGHRAVLSYTIGNTSILDSPALEATDESPVFKRILNIGPSDQPLKLRVAPIAVKTALRGKGANLATEDEFTILNIPTSNSAREFCLYTSNSTKADLTAIASHDKTSLDLTSLTQGGPPHWNLQVTTQAVIGDDKGPFSVDTLTLPDANPWQSIMRIGAFDFLPDGKGAALCTWNGDVWTVTGLAAKPSTLQWKRIASGLFQPLGLKIVRGDIYVTCRDQITVLRDHNGDGESDFIECFNNDAQVTEHFHEFAMGLQTDDAGNFYYAKSACHAKPAIVPQHGTLLRVSADGTKTDILANGFRAANGVCINPDGTFFVTDQEGHWTPKNRINRVVPDGGFHGNMLGYSAVTDTRDSAMRQPLCWITNDKDRSPAELVWVPKGVWGNLSGTLLNTSYGYGRLYAVPHESVDGIWQGGMVELPIPDFPTGIMRARFHPAEGQLYAAGCSVWASNCQTSGGFYRIRHHQKPARLPLAVHARADGLAITFSEPLDAKSASDSNRFQFKTWHLKRSKNYGSNHLDEKTAEISRSSLLDPKTVLLEIKDFAPTQCYELSYELIDATGEEFSGNLHGTIHQLRQASASR